MLLLYDLAPFIAFICFVLVFKYQYPKWKKSWDNEKRDFAKKIAEELKKK